VNHRIAGQTQGAPRPVGPYSQAVRVGRIVVTSGQTGVDPVTCELVGEDTESQTCQALRNIVATLQSVRADVTDIVQLRVFLADEGDFGGMNRVLEETLPKPYPARTTVYVGLPALVKIEIEAFAVVDDD